jgi:hypothetical protein
MFKFVTFDNGVTSRIYLVFKKHCIEESNCLTPRDFTFSVCLPLTFDLFVLSFDIPLVHFVVATESFLQKYAHHTHTQF